MDWQRLKPSYWFQNEPTCMDWDSILNKALDEYGVTQVDGFTCEIGPLVVWVSNWPYRYGNSYGGGFPNSVLPTVRTRKKLRTAVRQAFLAKVAQWPDKSRLKVIK